jgi:type IV secretion system protein VirB11
MRPGERTLRLLTEPLMPFLSQPDVTDVIIEQPGVVGVERQFTFHDVPELDFEHLDALCTLAAVWTHQDFGPYNPSCSSALPQGYRVQLTRPPVTAAGTISIVIRKRAAFVPTLPWLAEHGAFKYLDTTVDWVEWFTSRIRARKTFLIGGDTGSGKTTFTESCLRAIPLNERILTIEKTAEFADLPHRSWLPQYYGYRGDGELSEGAAVQLLEGILRQRPDRIIFGELRSAGEAFGYIRSLKAGHAGSITTIHSGSARGTIDSLAVMAAGNSSLKGMGIEHIRAEITAHVNILVHCDRNPYRVTEVVEL